MKHNKRNDRTEQQQQLTVESPNLDGGEQVGYLQVQLRSSTRDYQVQIQRIL